MASTARRSYADAIALLNSLQSNRAVVSSVSSAPHDMNLVAIPDMLEWTRKAGYDASDFVKRGLKFIHVAGTKGKGCCTRRERADKDLGKIELYTSPHLITVRERIRIDGATISESLFTRYFFELWDRFSSSKPNPTLNSLSTEDKPGYFRYLTILALHTFIEEGVETAIVECGIGGEYDPTNILPPEAVTVSAITRLGIDHIGMLGDTIESITMHKAGIMKKGVPVYTVEQVPEAQAVLQSCAMSKGVKLHVIRRLPLLEGDEIRLSLGGEYQKDNASLAIAVATSHLQHMGINGGVGSSNKFMVSLDKLSPHFTKALETTKWPGRWEVQKEGNIKWLIHGAHTTDSLEATAYWYLSKLEDALNEDIPPTATMLIFNQQDRDAQSLLRMLLGGKGPNTGLKPFSAESRLDRMRFSTCEMVFTHAAFCTNIPFKSLIPMGLDLRPQEEMAKVYESVASDSISVLYSSVEEAIQLARRVSDGNKRALILVTGSLHLVGALLRVLAKDSTNPGEHCLDKTPTQIVKHPLKLHIV